MDAGTIDRGDGVQLAWRRMSGTAPAVLFFPGFGSDMEGTKALALRDWCAAHGRAMLRFDYSGHGTSGGRFEDGTIGSWRDNALCVLDRLSVGKVLLVGSSMGGWLALLAAIARPERVAGLVGIAAAPDFTEDLMWNPASAADRATLLANGHVDVPSAYGPPQRITRALIEDGRRHLLLRAPIAWNGAPVRLLHGQRDPDVPWQTALRLAERIEGPDVQVVLVKDGDHRLSRQADLDLLCRTVAALGQDGGEAVAVSRVGPAPAQPTLGLLA